MGARLRARVSLAGLRSDRRRPGSGADRLRGAARRVGARRGCAAGGAGHPPRRPAVGDPARAQRGAPADRAAAQHAARARPVPAHRRPGGARTAAAAGDRGRPRGARGTHERGQDPRHGVRRRRRGLGLGGRARRRGHQRARRRGPGRHARAVRGPRARARGAGDRVRPAQRPRRAARPGARGAGARARGRSRGRHVGGDPRLPAQRPVRRARRPARPDPRGRQPGRLRARSGAALDRLAARHGAVGQLGRADGRRRGPGRDDDLRGDHDRAARRLRRAERDRARCPRRRGRPGLDRARAVAELPCADPWARRSSSPRSRPSAAT